MAARREMGFGTRLVVGGIAGFVATMAMTAAMRRLHAQLPAKERYPLTPREMVDDMLDPPAAAAPDLTLAAHFAYGAACGALVAAADPKIGRVTGVMAGLGVWLASYMGWIPVFGVLKPAAGHPLRRNAVMLAAHAAWGWSTAEAIRELADARETIFAGGPDKDAAN